MRNGKQGATRATRNSPPKENKFCSKRANKNEETRLEIRKKPFGDSNWFAFGAYVLQRIGMSSSTVGDFGIDQKTFQPTDQTGPKTSVPSNIDSKPEQFDAERFKALEHQIQELVTRNQNQDVNIQDFHKNAKIQDTEIQEQKREFNLLKEFNLNQEKKILNQDKKILNQDKKIQELKEINEEGEMAWGKLLVENVASQVLLVAAGKQPDRNAKEPRYFRGMARHRADDLARLTKLNEKYGFESVPDFAAAMDASIFKRNNAVHYSRIHDLDSDVCRAKRLLDRNALLKAECKMASKTIDTYPVWKEEFRSNFEF